MPKVVTGVYGRWHPGGTHDGRRRSIAGSLNPVWNLQRLVARRIWLSCAGQVVVGAGFARLMHTHPRAHPERRGVTSSLAAAVRSYLPRFRRLHHLAYMPHAGQDGFNLLVVPRPATLAHNPLDDLG